MFTKYNLKETFDLKESQCDLIILGCLTFIFQAICFYIMNPHHFKYRWCLLCFVFAFIYNITYYKFFINE
jgi:hypothetical protein